MKKLFMNLVLTLFVKGSYSMSWNVNTAHEGEDTSVFENISTVIDTGGNQNQLESSGFATVNGISNDDSISLSRVSLTDAKTSNSGAKEDKKSMAIVRPFSKKSEASISSSFDIWKDYPPCEHDFFNHSTVDLYLSFSQSFKDSETASQSLIDIQSFFKSGKNSWNLCITGVYGIDADIPPEEDIYSTALSATNVMWVNGPNRQFESIMNYFHTEDTYETVFIMEPDTIPRKKYWLDELFLEVEQERPFALLGSKYDGDLWSTSIDKVPSSLLHHVNGNSVYNMSNSYLKLITAQLKSEAKTPYNSIAYDHRISQIVHEGSDGVTHSVHPAFEKQIPVGKEFERNVDKFGNWWKRFGETNPLKESKVISNLALSAYLPKVKNNAIIVHGVNIDGDEEWDNKFGDITLVVSEWYDGLSSHIISDLNAMDHPFKQVTLMVPEDIASIKVTSEFPVDIQRRTLPDYMDICESKISTDWFMITDSYHVLSSKTELFFTLRQQSFVLSSMPITETNCMLSADCKTILESARNIYEDIDFITEDSKMLFRTSLRDKFCEAWKGSSLSQKKNFLFSSEDTSLSTGPTALSYFAYLLSQNIHSMYDIRAFDSITTHRNFEMKFDVEEAYHHNTGLAKSGKFMRTHVSNLQSGMRLLQGPVSVPVSTPSQAPSVNLFCEKCTAIKCLQKKSAIQCYACPTCVNMCHSKCKKMKKKKGQWIAKCRGCESGKDTKAPSMMQDCEKCTTSIHCLSKKFAQKCSTCAICTNMCHKKCKKKPKKTGQWIAKCVGCDSGKDTKAPSKKYTKEPSKKYTKEPSKIQDCAKCTKSSQCLSKKHQCKACTICTSMCHKDCKKKPIKTGQWIAKCVGCV